MHATRFTLFWYPVAYLILLYYGGRVCPYIDGLGIADFARELGVIFVFAAALRLWLGRRQSVPLTDLAVFALMATALTAYNRLHYLFPVGSGLKAAVGFFATGFFITVHAWLAQQKKLLLVGSVTLQSRAARSSIITRIALITVLSVILSTVTIFLVVNKDLK